MTTKKQLREKLLEILGYYKGSEKLDQLELLIDQYEARIDELEKTGKLFINPYLRQDKFSGLPKRPSGEP